MKFLLISSLVALASCKIIDITYMLEGNSKDTTNGASRSRHVSWHEESETVLNEHVSLEQAAAVQYRAL